MEPNFIVVVPAYNEAESIAEVASRAAEYADVCIVNDASTDNTREIAEAIDRVHVVNHETNTHIAGGILDGFRYALSRDYDFVITMDAGLSHDPDAIPDFQRHTDADLVIGYRTRKENVPAYRKALSFGANLLINLCLERRYVPWGGAGLRDVTSGYRMYSRRACELLVNANMRSKTFDFHIEALARVFRAGMKVEETPITYTYTNSSLRFYIVRDALTTCGRLWVSDLS
jgi:dolichol-phosphate mannosyltransferase